MDNSVGELAVAPNDQTPPTPISPLARARVLSGLIMAEALAAERLGRLTDKIAAAMLDANLFSIVVPKAHGGLGGTRVELFEAIEEIARADGLAGWCAAICNAISSFVHDGLTARARGEVFGNGPIACWATLRPKAKSVEVKGGFRVKGSFDYGTGSSLARWLMVPAPLPDRAGRQWFRAHVLPKENAEIKENSWDAMGLRATASVDYSIADTFVPAHRTFEYPFLADGNQHSASAQGLMRVGQIGMTAFASGISIRALAELIAAAPNTKRLLAEGMQAEDNVVQFGIGEFEGRLHAARRHYINLLTEHGEAVGAGREPDADHALGTLQAAQILARAARDLTVFAFDNAGTNVVLATEPLQRCLRDIFTGLKHAALTPAILAQIGKVRLGLDFGELRF